MRSTILSTVVALAAGFLTAASAEAGPIFEIIGGSPLTLPHPSGQGTQAASLRWGISGTGGGFLDGRVIFKDSFALPTAPGLTAAYDETDIVSFELIHRENARAIGGLPNPLFTIRAGAPGDPGQVTATEGQVVHEGTLLAPSYRLFLPSFTTSTEATVFALIGGGIIGSFTGDWKVEGIAPLLINATRPGDLNEYAVRMVADNTTPGEWRFTGFAVPEPSSAALLGIGLAGLAVHRRRRRRTAA